MHMYININTSLHNWFMKIHMPCVCVYACECASKHAVLPSPSFLSLTPHLYTLSLPSLNPFLSSPFLHTTLPLFYPSLSFLHIFPSLLLPLVWLLSFASLFILSLRYDLLRRTCCPQEKVLMVVKPPPPLVQHEWCTRLRLENTSPICSQLCRASEQIVLYVSLKGRLNSVTRVFRNLWCELPPVFEDLCEEQLPENIAAVNNRIGNCYEGPHFERYCLTILNSNSADLWI